MIVLDTHVLIWWVSGASALSTRAARAIGKAVRDGGVCVSTISVLEIATAVRRGRLELGASLDVWLGDLGRLPELGFEPVSAPIAQLAGSLDDAVPGDPADRIIAATARVLGATLVSADERLQRLPHLRTLW